MIISKEAIFNSFRNIGFEDDKPADEKLLLNHSICKGETGDLVILIGANNSGKSNVLDGLKTYQIVQIMGETRDIKYCASRIEYNQRWIEYNQRYIEDNQRQIEKYPSQIKGYQRDIECYQQDIERCLQQIEDCQRWIEDYQLKLGEDGQNLLKRAQTTLYSGEEYRNPKVVIPLIKDEVEFKIEDIKN
jgi:AAA15 family ATPase/GTPase